jgi:hypothetical protein
MSGDREFREQCYLFWIAFGEGECLSMRAGNDILQPMAVQKWWEAHRKWEEARDEKAQ